VSTYQALSALIPVPVCLSDACGIDPKWHRSGTIDPFGVVHFSDRRWTRAGARRFLMLAARAWRERPDSGYLNAPEYTWYHLYLDSKQAYEWAMAAGFRLPAKLSWADRTTSLRMAAKQGVHVAKEYPAVYSWQTGMWRDLDRRNRRIKRVLERTAAPDR
jgi:hypothetical protein